MEENIREMKGIAQYTNTGEINLEKHKQFVKAMQKTMKDRSVFIDCMNVTWFHIISSQKIH